MTIHTAVVSQVVPVGFADLAQAAEQLPGCEITEDRVRLKVDAPVGTGFVGAIRFAATLRTPTALLPPLKVEVVVSPWSTGRSEVSIYPMANLGQFESLRATRFFKAARAVLPAVIDRLRSGLPAQVPAAVELVA